MAAACTGNTRPRPSLQSFGSDLSEAEVAALFSAVDADGSGSVDTEELAGVLAQSHLRGQFYRLMRRCPVDGAELTPGEDFSNVIYIHLALDRGTGDSLKVRAGGFEWSLVCLLPPYCGFWLVWPIQGFSVVQGPRERRDITRRERRDITSCRGLCLLSTLFIPVCCPSQE